jgi:hypothetical protein
MTTDDDFADWIKEHGHGDTNRQLTKVLREVILACDETNGKGTITLTMDLTSAKGMAEVSTKISVKTPMPPLLSGSYFVGELGSLHTENPRQEKLPLRTMAPLPFNDRNKGD